jgi:phosphatidylethanolamine N-methyltransferase
MRKRYGNTLRKEAGLTKVMKRVTRSQVKLLREKAPELDRVVQEVRGTFERVIEETASIVEDFLAKCACSYACRV